MFESFFFGECSLLKFGGKVAGLGGILGLSMDWPGAGVESCCFLLLS